MSEVPHIVELNVGGVFYTTALSTLTKDSDSLLYEMFGKGKTSQVQDSKGKYFIDRDGVLFRYILDYLRNMKLILPENFHEKERLKQEAEFFRLPNMLKYIIGQQHIGHNKNTCTTVALQRNPIIKPNFNSPGIDVPIDKTPGFITIGYRGTFAFGRDGLADVKFRKLSRIIVCGRVSICRSVFKESLNESRDPDRGSTDRYTSRYFLKHNFMEQAFDMLAEEGFECVVACGSGTNNAGEVKPGLDTEEAKWQHYNEFIFERR